MNSRNNASRQQIGREELYLKVWETPMSRLAASYGISANGLKKICERLNIPYPPRGWWAKKAAGKKVVTYRLPPIGEDTATSVTITPTPESPPPPKLPDAVQKMLNESDKNGVTLSVPRRLTRPHRIISHWLGDHARRKEEAKRERAPWTRKLFDPGEFSTLDRRRHRILDALFKELERLGGKIEEDGNKLFHKLRGERIEFQLREKQKQVRRPLTEDEQRWRSSTDRGWRQELQGTGKLVFTIKTWMRGGLKTQWLEKDDKPLEELLPEIVTTMLTAQSVLAEMRRERAEEDQQRRLDAQRRAEIEARRRQEVKRWQRMTELAQAWRTADATRAFLSALKSMPQPDQAVMIDGRTLEDWVQWADARLDESDPFTHGIEAIFEDIAAQR